MWRVAMEGDDADLRDASAMFDSAELRVSQENDEYFLLSSRFDIVTEPKEVLTVGVDLLRLINGIAKTQSKAFEKLSLSYVAKDNPDGTQHIYSGLYTKCRVLPAEKGVLSDGTPILPNLPADVKRLVTAAEQEEVALRALTIYGELGDSWRGLYMVLDAIQQDTGGESDLLNKPWVSHQDKQDIKLFKQTANNYGVLGLDARHGLSGKMKKKPMSLGNARKLLRKLLNNWLASKVVTLAQSPNPAKQN
jgi:hypothetical protein